MRSLIVLLAILASADVRAGTDRNGPGARPLGLANAFVAIADDPWSVFYNPAGLVRISALQAAVFVSPSQYGMKELRSVCIGAAHPLYGLTLGSMVEQFGSDLYRETSVSLAVGMRTGERIGVGFAIHVNRTAIERYGAAACVLMDIGAIAEVAEDVRLGCSWKNIGGTTVGTTRDPLPQTFILGVCYEATSNSRATIEVEKDTRFAFIKKFAYEQRFFELLFLRLGISDEPDRFSCGIGFQLGNWGVSYAGYSHVQLGWTHQIEVAFGLSR